MSFTEISQDENSYQARLHIAVDHPCFDGHFPQYQIFPAVAQIDIVLDLLSLIFRRTCQVQAISKAKFTTPIFPGSTLVIKLSEITDHSACWALHQQETLCSSGKIVFE